MGETLGRPMSVEICVELGEDVHASAATALEFEAHETPDAVRETIHATTNLLISALPVERLEHLNDRSDEDDVERREWAEWKGQMERMVHALEQSLVCKSQQSAQRKKGATHA